MPCVATSNFPLLFPSSSTYELRIFDLDLGSGNTYSTYEFAVYACLLACYLLTWSCIYEMRQMCYDDTGYGICKGTYGLAFFELNGPFVG